MTPGFLSAGARCEATLVPATSAALDGRGGRPCVVMAHGFGCTRDSGLLRFAESFAGLGVDVLTFDYRGFGTSAGTPRQYVSHRRQRADWHAAIEFARSRPGVDPERIALWGTSYSGGHVLAVAARDHRIAAVVSQGPAVDGLAVLRKPEKADPSPVPHKAPRMIGAALRDVGAALLHRTPVTVPAVGPPGAFAMLTDASSYRDYLSMMGPTWRNEICARSLLMIPFNRPILRAGDVRCPTLLVIAGQDTIAPAAAVRDAARRIGARAEILELDCPHFDIYRGAHFETSVAAQQRFLARVLAPAAPTPTFPAPTFPATGP